MHGDIEEWRSILYQRRQKTCNTVSNILIKYFKNTLHYSLLNKLEFIF